MTLTLPSLDASTTSLQAIREQIQAYLGGPGMVASADKVKLLLNKKPIASSKKTVAEALEGSQSVGEVELGVMVMGGAPDPPPQDQSSIQEASAVAASGASGLGSEKVNAEAAPMEDVQKTTSEPVQPGQASGQAVLETDEFWTDLQGFLEQRIRSSEEALALRGVFEKAWRGSRAAP